MSLLSKDLDLCKWLDDWFDLLDLDVSGRFSKWGGGAVVIASKNFVIFNLVFCFSISVSFTNISDRVYFFQPIKHLCIQNLYIMIKLKFRDKI